MEETKLKLVVRTEKTNFILAVNLCDKTVSFFFFQLQMFSYPSNDRKQRRVT